MHLAKSLNDFRIRTIDRISLPELKAFRTACAKFKKSNHKTEQFDTRLKRLIELVESDNVAQLQRRDIRFFSSAIGVSPLVTISVTERFLKGFEHWAQGSLFRSIFKAFLGSYHNVEMRELLRQFIAENVSMLHHRDRYLAEQTGFLIDDLHLVSLASDMAESDDRLRFCSSKGLSILVLATSYGSILKLASLRHAVQTKPAPLLKEYLTWIFGSIRGNPVGHYYEALLSPFAKNPPPSDVQKLIIGKLFEAFKDPRLHQWPGIPGPGGNVRREECLATIRRWLSIECLELFIKVINATAVDRMWSQRRDFWMQYFDNDLVSDVTLAFADTADEKARHIRSQVENSEYMKWGTLANASHDQSVLIIQIGDLVIAEWSHNGATRFWQASDERAPKFHAQRYAAGALKNGGLEVRVNSSNRNAIRHDPTGNWMRWTKAAIEHHTGIGL